MNSRRSHTSRWWVWPLGLLAVVLCLGLSLTVGSRSIPFTDALVRIPDAVRYAFDNDYAATSAFDEFTIIMATLRLPRTILALIAGICLGGAGALIQGHTRNALADPGLLGINAGAALGVVLAVFVGLTSASDAAVLPALLGAGAAAAGVFALSSTGSTAASPLTLVLAGTAITALLMAFVNAMVITDTAALDTLRAWATGSVAGRELSVAWTIAPLVILGLLLAVLQARPLNLLGMGEDTAQALGLNVTLHRVVGLAAVACLGGSAVSAAGPVAFVGLAAPHAARAVMGPDYQRIIPASLIVGGALTLGADILGRVLSPSELPMGIVLGIVGVPIFIVLVKRGQVVTP
ncbi:iron ABC transporter permease [uncultured Corynebacterium sp.]|uniref:FecCD family ABC transporter permease n=1 Tax=uncultured Corynebacterium sp. TaxID=159447 RepID=UPI0025D3023C|nr:iron ABC transporter permease [uncultured Corynebacterium sp.]